MADDPADAYPVVALGRRLANGEFLLVGENRYRAVKAEEAIIRALGWGIALTALLALGGGTLLAVGFLRRIEEINRTSRSIMEGNLSNRVPTRGDGDEMDRLAVNLNAMLDRIQALMESLKRVSDDIAHDLRTPLSRLRQRLEVERARVAAPENCGRPWTNPSPKWTPYWKPSPRCCASRRSNRHAPRGVLGGASRNDRVDGCGDLRAGCGGQRPSAARHVEGGAVGAWRPRAADPDAGEPGRERDPLLRAAARITVSAAREAGEPVLCVADTGPGIPEAEREKVFRRFYRLEASRTTPGNGLGLALVKAVADLHGASVELSDNRPGLRVTVRFPAAGTVAQDRIPHAQHRASPGT